jgi:DNA-binding CsgD family transcriptional regulator
MFEAAREQLGAPAAAALLAEGAAMGTGDAIRYGTGAATAALPGAAPDRAAPDRAAPGGAADGAAPVGVADSTAPGGAHGSAGQLPRPPGGGPSVLTVREHEIATLAARGRSNKAIADELVISPRTVARHVANIFTKLGFSSRAQLAGWLADEEPGAGR